MAVGTGKNDPAGPRRDSSGRNASSASSPSRGGYNGARSGGNLSSNGLGIRTGSTIRGNTAFGPAGGMAQGYATNSRLGSGMGPSIGSFSNFRNTDGSAMFGGGLQNRAIAARNPQQALGMLRALQGAQGYQRPSGGRVGGLLDGEQVTVGPTTIEPAAAEVLLPGMIPSLFGGLQRALTNQRHVNGLTYMRNPTTFPQGATGYRQGYNGAPQSNASMANSMTYMRNPTAYPQGATGWRQGYSGGAAASSANPTWDSFKNSIGGWMGNGMTYRGK